MSIGIIMFGKAFILAIFVALQERYRHWRRTRIITLAFNGTSYYDPLPAWERRGRIAWRVTLVILSALGIAATASLLL